MQMDCVAYIGDPVVLQANPLWELQTGPTDYLLLLELSLSATLNPAATQQLSLGLGTPAARGVGTSALGGVAGAGIQPLNEVGSDTSALPGTDLFTYWTTMPTVPANYFRRWSMSLVTASQVGRVIRFPTGIKILPNSSLVLWLISEGYAVGAGQSVIDCTLVLED